MDVLRALGFKDASFDNPYPDGHVGSVAVWTFKSKDETECSARWARVLEFVKQLEIPGFGEYECIMLDKTIQTNHPFDPHTVKPFKLKQYSLPEGGFKESEVHISLDYDASDPRVMEWFISIGMVPAILPKHRTDGSRYNALVLTSQGDRQEIGRVVKKLHNVIPRLGGIEGCSIKFEVIEGYVLFGGFTTGQLPLVVKM